MLACPGKYSNLVRYSVPLHRSALEKKRKQRVSICHKIHPYSSTQVKLANSKRANVH